MTQLSHRIKAIFTPHEWAEILMDKRLDAQRGEGSEDPQEADWLDRHLEGCARCQTHFAERTALLALLEESTVRAPEGFVGRTLLRAKTRAEEPAAAYPLEEESPGWRSNWLGGAVAAAAALVFTVWASDGLNNDVVQSGSVDVSGSHLSGYESPDFVVRSLSMGAAQTQSQAQSIVRLHEGQATLHEGVVIAWIPRSALVVVMEDLARRGGFKVSKVRPGEIDPSIDRIWLKFELE